MVIILILTLLTFGIVTIAIVSGYYWASAESPVAQRLKTLVPELGIQAKARKKGPSLGARLLALLGTYSFGGSENSLAQRLSYAGIRGPRAVVLFLGMRYAVDAVCLDALQRVVRALPDFAPGRVSPHVRDA